MKRLSIWIAMLLVAGTLPTVLLAQKSTAPATQKPAATKPPPAPGAKPAARSQPAAPTKAPATRPSAKGRTQGNAKGKAPAKKPRNRLELDWEEMLPAKDRKRFSANAPAPVHDYLGEGGPPALQSQDFGVNPDLDGERVKLPGFIVPLDVGKNGIVNEFFLVPYFGACIHVPPPPPNQIVYVRFTKGIALDSIYEAYWVTGKMRVENKTTRLGAAAYALAAEQVEIYKY